MAENEKTYLDSNGLIRLAANILAKLNGKADDNHTHQIDSFLSSTSTNPVQNKVLQSRFNEIEEAIQNAGGAPVFTDDGNGNVILSNASVDNALEAIENGSY